jgi:hypothetical protein
MINTKLTENGLLVLKKLFMHFYTFAIISPWARAFPSFEEFRIHSPAPRNDLCQVCSKLA